MEKVTLKNIIEWTEGEFNNEDLLNKANEIFINDISKDTRTIKDGDIYLALSGKVFDGHDFINQAFESGAGFSIASDISKVDDKYKDRIIKVSDTQVALNKISAGYIEKLNIPVVAIGRINEENTSKLVNTNIQGISIVSAIMNSDNPKIASENLLKRFFINTKLFVYIQYYDIS